MVFGPMWLSHGKENWPGQPESLRESDPECLCEMKAESRKQVESDAGSQVHMKVLRILQCLLNCLILN